LSCASIISPRFDPLIDAAREPFRLGIFGGTFDPVHVGHLHVAECAREQFALDGVLFVPTGQPVRKQERELTPADDRFAMLKAAVAGNEQFDVSRIETDRAGTTYTIDTLRALRARYGERATLFFITGSDASSDMGTWKNANEISKLVTVLSARRVGFVNVGEAASKPAPKRIEPFDIRTIDSALIDVSSRQLREWVSEGRSIHYLVPSVTCSYIREQKLYGSKEAG
jgi:nicotinate-nucleotide adenylyltransferase